jgi:hypothetical protein
LDTKQPSDSETNIPSGKEMVRHETAVYTDKYEFWRKRKRIYLMFVRSH